VGLRGPRARVDKVLKVLLGHLVLKAILVLLDLPVLQVERLPWYLVPILLLPRMMVRYGLILITRQEHMYI
jgi:hypothetical protein